mmetsp:Transcript_2625/g.7898  ORF Transcript_2625/g.7898 Transcript_2625/m.7898 type:complete len:225 (-) Transcript_2625:26-700(-)|eukprot:CAMPEP_0198724408 /NCGR_PEP_ID=MMETSP1475-20131203/1892_1 /TAXON_ID= ORGANISM="Unidentified sp., Strain CCMP1999" /NCGR_SAMPLE_ID=MMETSP1475 /ASSEMBLY_ACC=CAM_ASM_001111 /LENGTH=224 /DNA_ID=CAMNT_0044485937 /DNA_START=36 /DNA_END=710 /DNA_ORIENTATION=-
MAFLSSVTNVQGRRDARARARPACRRAVVAMAADKDEVMSLVMSGDNFNRLKGVNMARELEPIDCLDTLSLTSKDPDLNVRYATVSQLAEAGKADPEKALDLLRDLIAHETDSSVRAAVADAFCAIGIPEAYEDVESIYRDSGEVMVQFSILAGLGELGNPKAFDLLKEVLEDEGSEELLKVAAIGALGELGDKRAKDLIKPFTEAEDATIKTRAEQALQSLQS